MWSLFAARLTTLQLLYMPFSSDSLQRMLVEMGAA
jgi:hypothetical protein